MADEPHAVVRLLVKRMESHPEEFSNDDGRWAQWLDELMPFVTEKERMMLRKPMMQTIHEDVMDELLNGPERRRKHEEDTEYERHLAQALQHTKHQALMQQAQVAQQNSYASQLGQYAQAGGGGASLPVGIGPYQNAMGAQGLVGNQNAFNPGLPVTQLGVGSVGTDMHPIRGRSATSVWMDESASIGSVTDTFAASLPKPTTINQIKKALGIKK